MVALVLAGIALSIVQANNWFVIPSFCLYLVFGLAAVMAVSNIITYVKSMRAINKARSRF